MSVFRRNVDWQITASVLQACVSALVLLLLGRTLNATGFGYFSIITSFVLVGNLMVEPRMQDVAARQFWNFGEKTWREEQRHHVADLAILEWTLKLLPCLTLVALSGVIAHVADLPAGGAVLICIAALGNYFSKLGYGLSTGILRVLGRSDQFTFCIVGEVLLRLCVLGALAASGQLTVTTAVITQALSGTTVNAIQFSLASRNITGFWSAITAWRWQQALGRLKPNRRLILSNLGLSATDLMNKDLDITLLSPMMPAEQIGVYKMAKNIAQLAWRAIDPITLALMPEISRRVELRNFSGTRTLLRQSSLGLGILALIVGICAYLGLRWFGSDILGAAFSDVPGLMALMLGGVVIGAPLVWGHPLAVALNRAELAFFGNVLSLVVGLLAFAVLVSMFGIRGAALAWSATFLPFFIFTATMAYRLFRRRESMAVPVDIRS